MSHASARPARSPLDPDEAMQAALDEIRQKPLLGNGGDAPPASLRLGDDNVVRSDQHASAAGKAEQKITTEARRHGGEETLPKVVAREHVPADIEETGEVFACLPPADATMVTTEMGRDAKGREPRSEPPPEPIVVPVRAAWWKSYWLALLLVGAPLAYAASVLVPRWTSDTTPDPRDAETSATSDQTQAPIDTNTANTAPTPTPGIDPSAPQPTASASAAPEPAPSVQPPHVQPPAVQPPTRPQPKVKPPPTQPSSSPSTPPTSSGFVPIHPIP